MKKPFLYKSYKIHGEPDQKVKDKIRDVAKKYNVNLTTDEITDNNGEYNRPDLIDKSLNFAIESDGLWHKTKKGEKLTNRRIQNYNDLGISCGIFDPELFNYLVTNCDNPYEWYMAPIIQTFNVNNQWGLEI